MSVNFIIRDAIASDIAACEQIDHTYDTDYVWQVSTLPEAGSYRLSVRQERLPRGVTLTHPHHPRRFEHALAHNHLLVACERDSERLLAYAILRHDPYNDIVTVCDLVVDRDVRRLRVGTRFFAVVRRWAKTHNARVLSCEVQHKNYPAIQFCQRQGLEFSGINDKYFADHEIALFFTQII